MITDNSGTYINLEVLPVKINDITKQITCLTIKQDGNEVKLRLHDDEFGFTPLDFFNDFVDALYKDKNEAFETSYRIISSSKEIDN